MSERGVKGLVVLCWVTLDAGNYLHALEESSHLEEVKRKPSSTNKAENQVNGRWLPQ